MRLRSTISVNSLFGLLMAVAALLMGPEGSYITGSDILADGGVTAAYWFGELALSV